MDLQGGNLIIVERNNALISVNKSLKENYNVRKDNFSTRRDWGRNKEDNDFLSVVIVGDTFCYYSLHSTVSIPGILWTERNLCSLLEINLRVMKWGKE